MSALINRFLYELIRLHFPTLKNVEVTDSKISFDDDGQITKEEFEKQLEEIKNNYANGKE